MKILLLEDDIGLGDIISEYLQDNDFELDHVYDGEEALSRAYETKYDLYIFDVNVPAIKGFDLLKMLRDNGDATPTIFVTSLNDIDDVSKGFESGADDYLKKPFELAELLLRIKNIQKRSFTQQRSNVIHIDKNITFDIDTELLHTGQDSVSLPQKELKLLKHFLQHPNEIITFENLYKVLWDYDETVSAESLRAHIKNLRKHLTKDMIQNLRGLGYRFEMKASD
ncbi:response regulator transcription factor [Campylobacterota bacterium]